VTDLREAVSAYNAYWYFLGGGKVLVSADEDVQDIIEAARLNVGEQSGPWSGVRSDCRYRRFASKAAGYRRLA
jgi:hypothetical protein